MQERLAEFVLDSSFTLRWCFEDETTESAEAVLTRLQNRQAMALVPEIWPYEVLNGLGKGVSRGRLERRRGLFFWREIRFLPIHMIETSIDEALFELMLKHNLSVYDASYLQLAIQQKLPLATGDRKLMEAALTSQLKLIQP